MMPYATRRTMEDGKGHYAVSGQGRQMIVGTVMGDMHNNCMVQVLEFRSVLNADQ